MNSIAFSSLAESMPPYSLSIAYGDTSTITFNRPTTSFEDDNHSSISSACGATSYSGHADIYGNNFTYDANWISFSSEDGVTYTLTINTSYVVQPTSTYIIPLHVRASLDEY